MKLRTLCLGTLLAAVSAVAIPQISQEAAINQVAIGDFVIVPPRIDGPVDNRFFGTYCQVGSERFCKSVRFLPDPCATLRDFRLHLDHLATSQGSRLLGRGTFRLDGQLGRVSVAAAVLRRGDAAYVAQVPGLANVRGVAELVFDGLGLSSSVAGERLTLRKDACGNAAPVVVLDVVGGPSFDFRDSVTFASDITDEDDSFPLDRLVFSSDRQGELSGSRFAAGRTLITSLLEPGDHRITVTVIDSGGLLGSDSLDVTIVNEPPQVSIRQPEDGSTVFATAPVLLEGLAYDPEGGHLVGGALRWELEVEPGAGFELAGFGETLTVAFPQATVAAQVRLRARDGAGVEATTVSTLNVAEFGGNAPPLVTIQKPEQLQPNHPIAAVEVVGSAVVFEATAADLEDSVDVLSLRWEFAALEGGQPDSNPTVPNPSPVEGVLATSVVFGNVADVVYRATFTARDSDNAETSRSVDVYVLTDPID